MILLSSCSPQTGSKENSSRSSRTTHEAQVSTVSNKPLAEPGSQQLKPAALSPSAIRAFATRGVIRNLADDRRTATIRHEEIPGFMPKMTMEFNVRRTNELAGLQAGDTITFLLKTTDDESWIEKIERVTSSEAGAAAGHNSPSSLLQAGQLQPGADMPDLELLAENGRPLRFSDFRGQALAFTFVFSRCPLPEFCPRMNRNFAQARSWLLEQSGAPTNWQFLSISFDPEFDRPSVLGQYARGYRGESSDRWIFAAAPTNVLPQLSAILDFRFTKENGSLVHNLRTVVLDPAGRIHRQFGGNHWKPEELAQAMVEAAQKK